MPKLTGVFEDLKNLSTISADDINRWLPARQESHFLENFLATRILYPQTIPLTKDHYLIDLAILKEAAKRNKELFLNSTASQLTISEDFVKRFPNLQNLVIALVEVLNPTGITQVYLKRKRLTNLIGTVIKPTIKGDYNQIEIQVENQIKKAGVGGFLVLSFYDHHTRIKINGSAEIVVAGGELGIVLDLRK